MNKHWLVQRLADFFHRHPVLLLLVVIVYFVSPLDVLPEALLGPVGLIDDILVLIGSMYLRRLSRQKDHIDTTAE